MELISIKDLYRNREQYLNQEEAREIPRLSDSS